MAPAASGANVLRNPELLTPAFDVDDEVLFAPAWSGGAMWTAGVQAGPGLAFWSLEPKSTDLQDKDLCDHAAASLRVSAPADGTALFGGLGVATLTLPAGAHCKLKPTNVVPPSAATRFATFGIYMLSDGTVTGSAVMRGPSNTIQSSSHHPGNDRWQFVGLRVGYAAHGIAQDLGPY